MDRYIIGPAALIALYIGTHAIAGPLWALGSVAAVVSVVGLFQGARRAR